MGNKHAEEDAILQKGIDSFRKAIETGNPNAAVEAAGSLIGRFGGEVVQMLLARLAVVEAKAGAIQAALAQKTALLESLLAAPRRVTRLLGLTRDCEDETEGGQEVVWGIVAGPPVQACRFHRTVDPEGIWDPDERVYVWLVESAQGAVIRGRIQPPPLVDVGLEQEVVFEGCLDGEVNDDETG